MACALFLRWSPLLVLAALAGCANSLQTTAATGEKLNATLRGQPAEAFFRAHGFPVAAMQLRSGGTLYEWRAGAYVVQMPSVSTFDATLTGNHLSGMSVTAPGGPMHLQCAIQIEADPAGTMVDVRILQDTLGAWTLSRCAEALGS
jgi:hypothetical protein